MRRLLALSLLVLCCARPVVAQTPRRANVEELKQLTIEELVDTDVTTASRRIERLADVAAAVTVISGEDLRRLGVTTLPQALQLAGHMHVSHVSGPQYAITTRGFAISTANKMLVLIDGRSVYSPVFGGEFWEMQDVVISDIDRIEVTRGPGGAMWGANAVNGVINVITKSTVDTRGTFVNVLAGTSVMGPFAIRHGGRLGNSGSYRVYSKVRFEDSHQLLSGADALDDFDFGQAGFRLETNPSPITNFTLQGDAYTGTIGLPSLAETNLAGGNVLARWTRTTPAHISSVQAYYDRTYRRVPSQYRGVLNTFDVDAQHQWHVSRHNVVFGAGFRVYDGDDLGDGPGFYFDPRHRVSPRFNVFAQDQITIGGGWFVTVGSKFERNEFTGFETQPTASLRWSGSKRSAWTSVSRAVRVPTRFDTDLRFRVPGTDRLLLTGSESFQSETVWAYEAGYRQQFHDRISIDIAGYVNQYDDLRSQEFNAGQPITLQNMMNATSRGVETTASAQVQPWWQVHVSHAYLWKEFTFDPGSTDPTGGVGEANDPANLFKVRSYINATSKIEIDAFYRFVGSLPQPKVDAYSEMDLRVGYRFRPWWDLSVIGTNLLHDRHLEFRAGTPPETYERAISLRSVWRF